MADLADGLIIDHSNVNSNNLTYRGKPVKFQKDKNSNIYRADVKFNEEEKKQGKQDVVLTYSPNAPTGTVAVVQALPENEDFKDLTDAEKFTKMNSLSYQTGTPEPTQIADGSQVTHIGVQANSNREEQPSDASKWHIRKANQPEPGAKEADKAQKETPNNPDAAVQPVAIEADNTTSGTKTSKKSEK
jgi:hypothetical protein